MVISPERGCHLLLQQYKSCQGEKVPHLGAIHEEERKGITLAFSVSSCQSVSLGLHVTARPGTPSSMFLEPKEAGEEL